MGKGRHAHSLKELSCKLGIRMRQAPDEEKLFLAVHGPLRAVRQARERRAHPLAPLGPAAGPRRRRAAPAAGPREIFLETPARGAAARLPAETPPGGPAGPLAGRPGAPFAANFRCFPGTPLTRGAGERKFSPCATEVARPAQGAGGRAGGAPNLGNRIPRRRE